MTIADVLASEVAHALGAPQPLAGTAVVWNAVESGDPTDAGTDADASGHTWSLTGRVGTALASGAPTSLLVVSRSRPLAGRDRGIRVHRVAVDAPGVRITARALLEGSAFQVELEGVEVTDDDAIGPPRDAATALVPALDRTCIVVVAEMLDAADAALDAAVQWVSGREQFGAPLATRQAVQHRAADMAMSCAAVRGLLDDARRAATGDSFAIEAVTAKLVASARLPEVTASAHQLHGGEGYYADRPLNEWHRRVCTMAALFGNASHQRIRLAGLLAE